MCLRISLLFFFGLNLCLMAQNDENIIQLFESLNKSNSNLHKESAISRIENGKYNLSDSLKLELEYHKAELLYLNSNYEESFKKIVKLIKLFNQKNYDSRVFVLSLLKVKNLYKLNRLEEALTLMFELENENIKDKSEFYVLLGSIYYTYNDINNSLKYNIKAETEALKYNNYDALVKIYNLFAVNYAFNKDFNNAITYYNKSLDLSKKTNNDLATLMILNNSSIYYTELGNYEKALEVLNEADKFKINSNNKFLNPKNLLLRAENLYFLKKYGEASQINESVIRQSILLKNDDLLSSGLTLKADILSAESKYIEAIKYYNEALELGVLMNKDVLNSENYLKISNLYEVTGNPTQALQYFKKYSVLKEKIDVQKNADELKQIEIRNNLNDYKQRLSLKNKEIELLNLKDSKNKFRNYLYIFLISGLIFFIYRQLRLKAINKKNTEYQKEISRLKEINLNNKISFANNQMTDFSIQIIEQSKLLEVLKKRLSSLKSTYKSNSDFKELSFMVNEALAVNTEKIKLNKEVDNTIGDFLYNLKSKYPILNEKEIQIISYLRLNYKSKQIATLLSINTQTVNNYRASIRSKLNLKKGQKLNQFLQKI